MNTPTATTQTPLAAANDSNTGASTIEHQIQIATASGFRSEILPVCPWVALEGSTPKREAITQMNAGGAVKVASPDEIYQYFKRRFALFV